MPGIRADSLNFGSHVVHILSKLLVGLLEHGNELGLREVALPDLVRCLLVTQGVRPVLCELPSRPDSSDFMLSIAQKFLP